MSASIHCMCFAEFFMCTRSLKNFLIGFAPICYGFGAAKNIPSRILEHMFEWGWDKYAVLVVGVGM